jgi:hypothetical protein
VPIMVEDQVQGGKAVEMFCHLCPHES